MENLTITIKFQWEKQMCSLNLQFGILLSLSSCQDGSRALPKHKPPWFEWRAGILEQRRRQLPERFVSVLEVKKFDSSRERAGYQRGQSIYSSLPLSFCLWFPVLSWHTWHRRRTDPPVPSTATTCCSGPGSPSFPSTGQHTADSQAPHWISVLKAGADFLSIFSKTVITMATNIKNKIYIPCEADGRLNCQPACQSLSSMSFHLGQKTKALFILKFSGLQPPSPRCQ